MKKWIKWGLISLLSLILVLCLAITFFSYIVFTPEKITPIINKTIKEQLGEDIKLGSADFTFFSSFPKFQIAVGEISLYDSLYTVREVYADIDIWELLSRDRIVIEGLSLENVNIKYVDPETEEVLFLDELNLEIGGINLEGEKCGFSDMVLSIAGHTIMASGEYYGDTESIDVKIECNKWKLEDILDLIPESYRTYPAVLNDISGEFSFVGNYNYNVRKEATLDIINAELKFGKSQVQLKGRLTDAISDLNQKLELSLNSDIDLSEINDMFLDSLNLGLKGRIKGETKGDFLLTDIQNEHFERVYLTTSQEYTSLNVKYDNIFLDGAYGEFFLEKSIEPLILDTAQMYIPKVKLEMILNGAKLKFDEMMTHIDIKKFRAKYAPESLNVDSCLVEVGDSDFAFSGEIKNLDSYIINDSLLFGTLDFKSNFIDADNLLALMDSISVNSSSIENTVGVDSTNSENLIAEDVDSSSTVFMVPDSVDLIFNSNIQKLLYNDKDIENLKGAVVLRNKKLILNQLGFTSDAAKMLLTGIYRSDRRDHLYAGFDFHLLDIDIDKLIDFIPMVDTLVPMLNSFKGEAEFHFAGETYLDSLYAPKISTLRAAAAIEGKNLILLDDETFSTISKYLLFKKKTENKVDSIAVEATVFRNNIDLYPFLISMDKWQAVIAGRHNLNQQFSYHISVTDCPLPARLGLNISGNFDDMKFKLAPCRYKSLYKPKRQNEVDKRVLGIKKLVSESLKNNVEKHYSQSEKVDSTNTYNPKQEVQ